MSLFKSGVLLKNERLKQYKKPSTWILMGVIVLIAVLVLLFSQLFESTINSFIPTWQDQYHSSLQSAKSALKENPDDLSSKAEADSLLYLLEHEVDPYDWRTDVVLEYYSLKYGVPVQGGMYYDKLPYYEEVPGPTGNLTEAQKQERMAMLWTVLEKNDWETFIDMKIDDLESGYRQSRSEQEKKVDIEVYQLYKEKNIVPVAENANTYYDALASKDISLTWKSKQVESIRKYKMSLLRGEDDYGNLLTQTELKNLESEVDVSLQRLGTDTPPVTFDSFLGMLEGAASSLGLITILVIVYAGNLFASEYGSGTIKLLLITPHKRRKIYLAKVLLLLEMSAITMGILFVLSFLLGGAFTGFKGIGSMQVLSLFGRVTRLPYLLYILLRYLLLMLPVLTYGALAVMMSVVTRKSAVAIAVTLLIVYGSELFMSILMAFSGNIIIPGAKFLIFANTSLENYLPSVQPFFEMPRPRMVDGTMTLGFSVVILLLYLFCFLWIAHDSFCRRDVK